MGIFLDYSINLNDTWKPLEVVLLKTREFSEFLCVSRGANISMYTCADLMIFQYENSFLRPLQ